MSLSEYDLKIAERQVDAAAVAFERGVERLKRPDGAPVYGPEETAERIASLASERDAVLDGFGQQANEELAAVDVELAAIAGNDPIVVFSDADQERAGRLRAFIQEDATLLPMPELEKRIGGVVATKDRVQAVLFARYLGQRIDRGDSAVELRSMVALLTPVTADSSLELRRLKALDRRDRANTMVAIAQRPKVRQLVESQRAGLASSGAYVPF